MNNPSKMTHEQLDALNVPRKTSKVWTLAERRAYAQYNPPKPQGSRMWKSDHTRAIYELEDGSPDEMVNGLGVWNE